MSNQNNNTMYNNNTFRFAINTQIVGKSSPQAVSYSGAFIPVTGNFRSLADHIGRGHPWMPALLDEGCRRLQQHANYAEVLAIDVDNAIMVDKTDENGNKVKAPNGRVDKVKQYQHQLTIEDALNNEFFRNHCGLGIESTSSTPDWNKARFVFRLPRPVVGHKLIRLCNEYLINLVGVADPSCKDASRFFYGALDRKPFILNESATLPSDFVEQAIAWDEARKVKKVERAAVKRKINQVSTGNISVDVVREALSFIPPRTPGSGTYHESVSVLFALYNTFGEDTAIELAEEWSPKQGDWNPEYKIRGFKNSLTDEPISIGTLFFLAKKNGYVLPKVVVNQLKQERKRSFTEVFKGFCGLGGYTPTHVQNSNKFVLPPITKPLTFISSACKTGKTSALIEEVRARMAAGYRVIWITYRNSLAFQTCEKLGIPHVHEFNSDAALVSNAKAFACCPDSLHLLSLSAIKEKFFVVIDEADATLSHILKGETMGDQHEAKLEHFLNFVRRVKTWGGNIVMMEDSLSAGMLDAYRKMFGLDEDYDFFLNTKYVSQYPVTLGSGSPTGLLQAITRDLENGKRIIFVSDAQEKLESYHRMLDNLGINTRIIRVDSTTVDEDEIKQFVATPDSCIESAKYGLVMISPTAESGLSITHPNIDVVYGYFTHSQPRQIIQMLERYRLDVPRKIYVREFCTDAQEIRFMNPVEVLAQWQAAHEDTIKRVQLETKEFKFAVDEQLDTAIANLQIQREDSTQKILNENLAWFKARDNAAKANLLENLTWVLTERGHQITPIKWEFDKDLNDELNIAVDEIRDDKAHVIADAPDDGRGYEQAKKDLESHSLNKEEQAICKKIVLKHQLPGYDVENYKAVRYVTERRGKNRKRVENFYHIIAPQVAKEKDRRSLIARLSQRSLQMLHHSPNRVRTTGAFALLYDALIQPIITGGEYTNETQKVIELNQILVTHAEQFREMTGLTFKPCQEQIKDANGNIVQPAITPVTNGNKLLKWLGLNPVCIKRGGSDGARQRVYKCLPSEFFYETLAALVARDSEMLEDADRYNTSAILNRVIQLLKTVDVNGSNPYVDSTGKLNLPPSLIPLVEKARQKMSINTH